MSLSSIVRLLYPSRCAFCGELLPDTATNCACVRCEERLPRVGSPVCLCCGHELCSCVCCELFEPRYDGITAPFYYSGAVKQAIRRFKFNGRFDLYDYFADQMVSAMHRCYRGLHFDFALAVPMTSADRRQRGYNQSELLCGRLCKLTSIPLACGVLVKQAKTARQHELELAQRLVNLKNAYSVPEPSLVYGKTILLCDDIKTSGSTLSECADTLKRAGAAAVYAVCIAVTPPH